MPEPLPLVVGKPAPVFQLNDAAETPVALKDFRGKWVVLYFYPKDNTESCTVEALDFSALEADFAERNAVVLGISPDSCASHRRFIAKKSLRVKLLSDPEKKSLKAYGVWQEKSMFGKKYMGVVRSTVLVDPSGKIRRIWENVRVKGHAQAVLDSLSGQ
ncbi:MAG: peroxiredoxin [Calditrichaeota bacterium]|nr:peroxiredoxin [Calditrichota bacterium]